MRELDRAESYRFFHIRFTRQLFQKVDERQHPDVCSLVNFDQGIRGETYDIRVTTSRGRNDQLRPGIFRQLISLLRTGDARPFISTAKVKYRDSTDGTIKPVNLLEENIEKEKYVAREDEHHRSINSNAMFSALEEAYAEITRDGILQDAILANFGGIDDAPGGGV